MAVPHPKRASTNKLPFLNHLQLQRAPKSPQPKILRVKQVAKKERTADKHPPLRPRGSRMAKGKGPLVRDQARQERRGGKTVVKKLPGNKSLWSQSSWSKPKRLRTPAFPSATTNEQSEWSDLTEHESAAIKVDSGLASLAANPPAAESAQKQPALRQQTNAGNNQVVFADVAYTEQTDRSYVQVSVLEEVWEVNWVHAIQACWKQEWLEIHPQIAMDVQEARHENNGRVVWVRGEFELTGYGTTGEGGKVAHETLRLPFTSTVLRPPVADENTNASRHFDSALSLQEKWIETGDWKVSLMSEPFRQHGVSAQDYSGVVIVSGRIWWFRKQLVPLRGLGDG
ncbi:hypothetical protein [Brevibacillus sp. SAFN-007a]|uniref:hypothetical protein n=1 Tax=Brevibacillus sp. SAFN-007a TaxID=3436862 RepID=UPI003F80CDB0